MYDELAFELFCDNINTEMEAWVFGCNSHMDVYVTHLKSTLHSAHVECYYSDIPF